MKKFSGLFLACLLLICLGIACEKNQDVPWAEALPEIPASYGELEAVTSVPEYPGWLQLWFQDDAGTIRIVRVHLFDNVLLDDVKTIERTGSVVEEVVEDEG
ncbi:MAG: hypothetical protein OEV49_15350 [candidate division Zixibacteria bacterium]|nr:hypothetical protein [candidate division Zixibacteria bacterium]MDH3936469.1 hypothetical protein [candidate division Zixibacteria bacterium]MDH4034829.1 hypothetical protein [candidate division Zixibacteria bacterium]